MNYRHIYHAGHFSDVFKHVLLTSLIQTFLHKDKPFCYLETHAGIGIYDLQSEAAQKTLEHTQGILKIWNSSDKPLPTLIHDYLQIVRTLNTAQGISQLRYYPGSPCYVRNFLRQQDRMILNELHPEDVLLLKRQFSNDRRISVHHLNGYQALKAFLPPKERRGLVLMDPPFEKADEFLQLQKELLLAIRRWDTGTYAIWYPIKDRYLVNHFYEVFKISGIRKILCCELEIPSSSTQLNACGMMIIHPPWQWEKEIAENLSWLSHTLAHTANGNYRLEWLVAE